MLVSSLNDETRNVVCLYCEQLAGDSSIVYSIYSLFFMVLVRENKRCRYGKALMNNIRFLYNIILF